MLTRNHFHALFVSVALAVAPACGDDDSEPTPDAAPSGADAATDSPDASADSPDASADSPDAMPDSPDAMPGTPDAMPAPDAEPLVGIEGARSAADGAVDIDIADVLVTYTKVAVGSDVAGFFVQSAMTGPALFIAVDPAGLDPVPAVGQNVSFTVTEMGTAGMLRQATAITGLTVNSSDNDVTALAQVLNDKTDLVSAIGDYEAELSIVAIVITGDFASAGSEHQAAVVETAGITGDTGLRLRVPTTLRDSLGLVIGCDFKVEYTPMWRFGTTAQISAWNASELNGTCPAPTVVSAVATSETAVEITFDRDLDVDTVIVGGDDFSFDNGLTATAASVSGRVVTVTTSTQTTGTTYTVTVANTVKDVLGAAIVTGTGDSTTFIGFGPESTCNDGLDDDVDGFIDCFDSDCGEDDACAWESKLYIWEVDADTPGTDAAEFLELWNNTGAEIDFTTSKYFVLFINGSDDKVDDAVQLTGTLANGEVYVVGAATVSTADLDLGVALGRDPAENLIQNGADGVLLVRCDDCTNATTDFPDDVVPGTEATFTTADGKTATKIDAVAYDTNDADDAGLLSALGVDAQWNEAANGDSANESIQRSSINGWAAGTPNPGFIGPE